VDVDSRERSGPFSFIRHAFQRAPTTTYLTELIDVS
jgi:hypothetical protein